MKKIFLNLTLLVLFCFSVLGQEKDIPIIDPIERMPVFPGGEQKIYEYIKSKIVYTQRALDEGIQERVTVRFLIRKTGDIDSVKLVRGLHPDCDSVAMNIVKTMPKWTSGSQGPVKVDVWYTLPVVFKLSEVQVYTTPEQMPSYPGGEPAMFKFINENLKYFSMESCFQGRVTIRFIVTKEGKIVKPVVIRSLSSATYKEALRVINLMPDWIPGKHKGELVNVYYTIPIVFRLSQ